MADPVFTGTVHQMMNWCTQHYHSTTHTVVKTVHDKWSLPHMSTTTLVILGLVGVYFVGRIGLPALWSDTKSVYAGVRGLFGGSKTTAAATPVA